MNEQALRVWAQSKTPEELKRAVHLLSELIDLVLGGQTRVIEATSDTAYSGHATELTVIPPVGGWASMDEVRSATTAMTEAIKADNWVDGFMAAMKVVVLIGGVA